MSFENLNLIKPILTALKEEGYTNPTPIQAQAIPLILSHKDILGCAQTGTGKTAAFSIPILQLLHERKSNPNDKRKIKALILTPTRELAIQIGESIDNYGKHTGLVNKVIFGGVSQHGQVEALKKGIDILVATPGRLLDLIHQKFVHLNAIEFFVLDEADRMLDMGFVNDVKKVIALLPSKRQSLFFSATMPPVILKLADTILVNPAKVEVAKVSSTANTIEQVMYLVDKDNKRALLHHLLKDQTIERVLVFTRTKHGADRVMKDLKAKNIEAQAIHGNKSQNARQHALNNFKSGLTRVLVATDIAARGIDIDDLTHVINYELPNIPESYVHRIGRTGRAGANGKAIGFCDIEEMPYLKDIQKVIGKTIRVIDNHPFPMKVLTPPKKEAKKPRENNRVKRGHTTQAPAENNNPQQSSQSGRHSERQSQTKSSSNENRNSNRNSDFNRSKPNRNSDRNASKFSNSGRKSR